MRLNRDPLFMFFFTGAGTALFACFLNQQSPAPVKQKIQQAQVQKPVQRQIASKAKAQATVTPAHIEELRKIQAKHQQQSSKLYMYSLATFQQQIMQLGMKNDRVYETKHFITQVEKAQRGSVIAVTGEITVNRDLVINQDLTIKGYGAAKITFENASLNHVYGKLVLENIMLVGPDLEYLILSKGTDLILRNVEIENSHIILQQSAKVVAENLVFRGRFKDGQSRSPAFSLKDSAILEIKNSEINTVAPAFQTENYGRVEADSVTVNSKEVAFQFLTETPSLCHKCQFNNSNITSHENRLSRTKIVNN